MKKLNNKMKHGFTLIEIVIVLAILGVLYFTLADSLFGKKEAMSMSNTIRISTNQLSEAISETKHSTRNFQDTGTISVWIRMGTKVGANDAGTDMNNSDAANEYIESIGLNGLCRYKVAPDALDGNTSSPGDNNLAVKVLQDCSEAARVFGWTDRQKKSSEDMFVQNMNGLALAGGNVVPVFNATNLKTYISGLAGDTTNNFDTTGGTNIDAKVGVRHFTK
jgi:prepilin-type N-terminal cleavage/methylation domain-containing protein